MKTQNQHLLSDFHDTIVALCTPQGKGSIALIRLSGNNVIDIVDRFAHLSSQKTLHASTTHTIHHGHCINPEDPTKKVDEVLFLLMNAPKTFTGQDTIEISCHNNPFIIEQIISLSVRQGARLAKPGEFTKRAFLNGKIDLAQAEAINDIITAPTPAAVQKALSQLGGSLSHYFNQIEAKLITLVSLVESSFEFLEEEQRDLAFDTRLNKEIHELLKDITYVTSTFNQQQQIKEGIRIAFIGSVNAGKSTLFNALLKKNRAIVSAKEGTTRDSIEASLYKNGYFLTLVDTAGLRETDDYIEQEGITRSHQEAALADAILLIFDTSQPTTASELAVYYDLWQRYKEKIIIVGTKHDQASNNKSNKNNFLIENSTIVVSAQQNSGLNLLEDHINTKIADLLSHLKSPFLLNQRQGIILSDLEQHLEFIANSYSNRLHYELVAYQLKDMLEKIADLTGHNITEKVLDNVFSTFCVGK